ncbi:hypothetical protein ACWHA1_36965 [Streptomyces decoyicus]
MQASTICAALTLPKPSGWLGEVNRISAISACFGLSLGKLWIVWHWLRPRSTALSSLPWTMSGSMPVRARRYPSFAAASGSGGMPEVVASVSATAVGEGVLGAARGFFLGAAWVLSSLLHAVRAAARTSAVRTVVAVVAVRFTFGLRAG